MTQRFLHKVLWCAPLLLLWMLAGQERSLCLAPRGQAQGQLSAETTHVPQWSEVGLTDLLPAGVEPTAASAPTARRLERRHVGSRTLPLSQLSVRPGWSVGRPTGDPRPQRLTLPVLQRAADRYVYALCVLRC
ncbi:MAG: hypothetical protein IJ684_04610 [Bacteroidales bacterium]|nr:hypothetical protein [Bacteroidales bacterium]